MFPLPFNFPFRKKDGSLSTIGDEINAGGGGSSYTLPTASADVKGGVKVGAGLTMDGEVLKNTNPTPATPYTLPIASANTLGGVKVGSGLSINEDGILSAGGGGSTLYRHDIMFMGTDLAVLTIINDSDTVFTEETLKAYFVNKNITASARGIMATGVHGSDMILVMYYTGSGTFQIFTSGEANYPLTYSSMSDHVISI